MRSLVTGTAVLAVAAAVGIVGAAGGYPATRPRLLSGSAWLPSAQVGQLTLLDGASAEVAAQVPVAEPGNSIDAVQQGSTAFVVNRTAGVLRRVDGATFDVSRSVELIPGARAGLRAFAGPGALYALDADRGVLAEADPQNLTGRGDPVSMAARVATQASSIDDAGRLWVLDGETGNLDWVKDGQRHTRQKVVAPGTGLLTLAGGRPVVVDQRDHSAVLLDPGSSAGGHRTNLDLRSDDRIEVSGAPHASRLYVVASRGVLAVCELTAPTCTKAIALGTGGAELGAALETAGRVFVPDYTAGRVWIVDLTDLHVVAQPPVVPPGTRFQLLTRDDVVFFNDPLSEHAGVIRLDGGVRQVAKYDPHNPQAGVTHAGGVDQPKPPDPGPVGQPPKRKPGPKPSVSPTEPQPGATQPQPQPQPSQSSTDPVPQPQPPPPLPDLKVSASASPSLVGQDVQFAVAATTDPQPVDAQWTFGDGTGATGLNPDHAWAASGNFRITVTVTFPDLRTKQVNVTQQVNKPQPLKGTLNVTTDGPGTIVSTPRGISCPPRCSAQFDENTQVTLDARATPDSQFEEYDSVCAGQAPTCQFTISAAGASVTGTFTAVVNFHNLTLNISDSAAVGGGGIVDVFENDSESGNDHQCDQPSCTTSFPNTMTLLLEPNGEGLGTSRFDHWKGACSGTAVQCHIPMTGGDKAVTAVFVRCPVTGCLAGTTPPAARSAPRTARLPYRTARLPYRTARRRRIRW